jgi:hypothetical protein
MDEIVVAAGTALVEAIAVDGWTEVRDAVAGLWRRARGERSTEDISGDLEVLRAEILEARAADDHEAEDALTGEWRSRLRRLAAASTVVEACPGRPDGRRPDRRDRHLAAGQGGRGVALHPELGVRSGRGRREGHSHYIRRFRSLTPLIGTLFGPGYFRTTLDLRPNA